MSSVCAVVVTYNRKKLLIECLRALLNQTLPIDTIFVIDNASHDGTYELLESENMLDAVTYERLSSNLGGAGGFAHGLKKAFHENFSWYWIMDDDAEPALNALEMLLKAPLPKDYSALASTVYTGSPQEHTLQIIGHRGRFDKRELFPVPTQPLRSSEYEAPEVNIDMASFVGILLPHHSIAAVGFPDAKYFIHHDDTEYALRLSAIAPIIMRTQSHIFHKEVRTQGRSVKHFLMLKKTRIAYEKLWIMYYSKRNTVEIARRYSTSALWKLYLNILKDGLLLSKDILLFDDHKYRRLKFAWSAYYDGLSDCFDNTKPRRILYGEGTL